ncbi:MAG: cation:proton antiporter [Mariprofundus sp.]|nr:cation:proton antiporter [Mariprofundus sp.]
MPLSESILILMALLAVAMLAIPLSRLLPIPYTVILVGIGMTISSASHSWPLLHMLQSFQLTPELVMFVFLPALIFESGYNLNARQLIKDLLPVLLLAVPGLLVATFIVGFTLHWIMDMPLALALLFGALISATDPVAVIALFKELGAPLRLTVLVEGESLFNDATAIVLVHILLGIVVAGSFEVSSLPAAGGQFLYVFFGGALLGLIIGLVFCEWMHLLSDNPSGILILSIILAYVSFIAAEHFLHISGVMSVVGASLALGIYGITRIPHHTGEYLRESWEFFAYLSNALLFLLVGLSIDLQSLYHNLAYILLAIAVVLLSRLPSIYLFLPMALRRFHLPRVRTGEMHIMWWGGLKGGLAIAIVLALPESLANKQLLLDMTLGVVVFTLLINAPTIKPLMSYLGLNKLNNNEQAELHQGLAHAKAHAHSSLNHVMTADLTSPACLRHAENLLDQSMQLTLNTLNKQQRVHHVHQIAMRAQMQQLEHLHDAGMVPQYILLDIKNALRSEHEHEGKQSQSSNPFLKLEQQILARLRENDSMSGFLSKYQNMRLSSQLQRLILRLLMLDAAILDVSSRSDIDDDNKAEVTLVYQQKRQSMLISLQEIRDNFPDFFTRFETRMSMQIALDGALWQADDDFKHGETGKKAYDIIRQQLAKVQEKIPPIHDTPLSLSSRELIQMVPLFADLSAQVLRDLAAQAAVVTFLSGDIVINQGEKGDALYIISRGIVTIQHVDADHTEQLLAELKAGDFFGEMALLGDQVRKACVVARQPLTLLRLRRKHVLLLAAEHPQLDAQLKKTQAMRSQHNAAPASP